MAWNSGDKRWLIDPPIMAGAEEPPIQAYQCDYGRECAYCSGPTDTGGCVNPLCPAGRDSDQPSSLQWQSRIRQAKRIRVAGEQRIPGQRRGVAA